MSSRDPRSESGPTRSGDHPTCAKCGTVQWMKTETKQTFDGYTVDRYNCFRCSNDMSWSYKLPLSQPLGGSPGSAKEMV